MPEIDETQTYVLAWPGADTGTRRRFEEVNTLIFHDLPESDPDYNNPEYTWIRTYARDQLRPTDTVITSGEQAEVALKGATPEEPIAIPVSLARELDWFPDARFEGEA
jgi:hypothetical protein